MPGKNPYDGVISTSIMGDHKSNPSPYSAQLPLIQEVASMDVEMLERIK